MGSTVTWASFSQSAGSGTVTIPAGTRVLIATSPADTLPPIEVEGELIVPNLPLSIAFESVLVMDGGHLWIGSASCPITAGVDITLVGESLGTSYAPSVTDSNKVIGGLAGGQIDIHGTVPQVSWTTLGADASALDDFITTAVNTNWKVGSTIVIASTDFPYYSSTYPDMQVEERVIEAISGRTITLNENLEKNHYGHIYSAPQTSGATIDMRAEVGLLTRTLKIHGDTEGGTGWGGHILAEGGCQLRISGTELYNMGQTNVFNRYPVNIYHGGDQSASYVRANAIHSNYQGCVAITNVQHLSISDNVCYNSFSHMFYMGEGSEYDNTYEHNLGLLTYPHTLLRESDTVPAIFFISNPRNTFKDNVAAVSYVGYHFSFPDRLVGESANLPIADTMFPRRLILTLFDGNTAHSLNRDGIHIDRMMTSHLGDVAGNRWEPRDISWASASDIEIWKDEPSLDNSDLNKWESLVKRYSPRAEAGTTLTNTQIYKVRTSGIWANTANINFEQLVISDSYVGLQFGGMNGRIGDSVIIGESDNLGNPRNPEDHQGRNRPIDYGPTRTILGMILRPYTINIAERVKFVNFMPMKFLFSEEIRLAGAIGAGTSSVPCSDLNHLIDITFHDAVRFVFTETESDNALRSISHRDVDGSLTGTCGSHIVSNNSFYNIAGCVGYEDWNALVCPPGGNGYRTLNVRDVDNNGQGKTFNEPSSTERDLRTGLGATKIRNHEFMNIKANDNASDESVRRHDTNHILEMNQVYLLQYGDYTTPKSLQLRIYYSARGEWIKFGIPYPPGTTFTFDDSLPSYDYTQVFSYNEVKAGTYFYDESTNVLWMMWETREEGFESTYGAAYLSRTYYRIYIDAVCPNDDCYQEVDPNMIVDNTNYPVINDITECEAGGGVGGGRPNAIVSATLPVFTASGGLDETWNIITSSERYEITQFEGQQVISMDYSLDSLNIRVVDRENPHALGAYTHLQYKVRAGAGYGTFRTQLWTRMFTDEGQTIATRYVSIESENPLFAYGSVTDSEWLTVTIPLDIMGVGYGPDQVPYLYRLNVWGSEGNGRPVPLLFTDFKFITATVEYIPTRNTPNFSVPSRTPVTPLDPLTVIQESGVEPPPGVAPVVQSGDVESTVAVWAIVVVIVMALVLIAIVAAMVFFFLQSRESRL